MALMSPVDSAFLLLESREHPMHVGGLALLTPSEGSDESLARSMYRDLRDVDSIRPLFRRKPQQLLSSFASVSWAQDKDVDLEYHVRLSALPKPGRVRELLELVSRLHGTLLDRHRPLWEATVIEGLADGRVAVYIKTHHALIDGVSASRIMYRALSSEPDGEFVPPWVELPRQKRPSSNGRFNPLGLLGTAAHTLRDVAGIGPATATSVYQALKDEAAALPFQAPRTMFNVPITGARRFAAQSWPMERLRAVSDSAGVTVNDTMLAMSAGALRRYLLEQGALPDQPLIAMVPVSLRKAGAEGEGAEGEGNAVGAVLCNLGTELTDPAARLLRIHTSMRHSKTVLSGLSPLQILAVSVVNIAGAGLALGPVPAIDHLARPAFNIVISNVPGPSASKYWNGARLENFFPASISIDGQALNITATSYADTMQFGLVGCRRNVPSLQRLLIHLEDSLVELEEATS